MKYNEKRGTKSLAFVLIAFDSSLFCWLVLPGRQDLDRTRHGRSVGAVA